MFYPTAYHRDRRGSQVLRRGRTCRDESSLRENEPIEGKAEVHALVSIRIAAASARVYGFCFPQPCYAVGWSTRGMRTPSCFEQTDAFIIRINEQNGKSYSITHLNQPSRHDISREHKFLPSEHRAGRGRCSALRPQGRMTLQGEASWSLPVRPLTSLQANQHLVKLAFWQILLVYS